MRAFAAFTAQRAPCESHCKWDLNRGQCVIK